MTRTAIFILAGLTIGCDGATEPAVHDPPAVRVTTVSVTRQPLARTIEAGGVVQARGTATLASRIMAPVSAVRVSAGDRVRAGQPLVVLDSRDIDAHARRAASAIAADEHAVRAAEADREAAAAAATLARAAHERIAQLHARRSATAHELDEARGALQAAEARLAAATARVAAAESILHVSRDASDAAAVTASFAVIRAPFDGVITETLVDPGDLASPGAPLVRLEDTRGFTLEIRLDESDAAFLGVGQPVDVIVRGGEPMAGRISEISRRRSEGAHTFLTKIELPAAPGLHTGMFARARMAGPERQALVVPAEAVITQGQLPMVFVASGGRARLRVVRLGPAGGAVEVLAGLASGERVIAAPPPSLRDGDAIDSVPAPAGAR